MKKLIPIVLVLALGIAIGVVVHRRVLAAEQDAAVGALRIFGNVDIRDAQLAFFGQERVATVLAEEGDAVTAGQTLATLRTERLDAELASVDARIQAQQAVVAKLDNGSRAEEVAAARAEVTAAEVTVANAERVIARVQTTSATGASSAQDLDDARAALDVANATLEVRRQASALVVAGPRDEDKAAARANLAALAAERDVLLRRKADSTLTAPAAGIVRTRILEPGEMAAPERPAFTLALTDPKWIRAWIPEPDLGRIASGMRATIRSDSFGGREYAGWVGSVSPVAEFTPRNVETADLRTKLVYEVRVFVRDPAGELPLGMPVTVDVDTAGGTGHAGGDGR